MSRPILAPRRRRDMLGVSTASSWPSDDDPMDATDRIRNPDPEIRKNRIFHFWHVVYQINRLCKPVRNLQEFLNFQIRLIRKIRKTGKTGIFTFGM